MMTINDLASFGVFMTALWNMMPYLIQNMILAVASLAVVIGVMKLFD